MHRLTLSALAGLAIGAAGGCGGVQPIQPLSTPTESTGPATPPPPAPPPQTQLPPAPEPAQPAPPPPAPKRVAVLVTERLEGSAEPRWDAESEAVLAEALLAARREVDIEVVKRETYEQILNRDFEALVHQGLPDNVQVLSNLLKAGVDYFAMAEVDSTPVSLGVRKGKAPSDRPYVQAGLRVVRTEDGAVLAAAKGDAQEATYRDARARALAEAAQRVVEDLRNLPQAPAIRTVTITVDGLSKLEEAERILGKLKDSEGVIWARYLRFLPSAPGATGGVARFEIAFHGSPEELRARVMPGGAGTRLEMTRIEGDRWSYHLVPGSAEEAPQKESPKAEK